MNWYFEALKKYSTFEGRASRKEYWMYILISLIVFIFLRYVVSIIDTHGFLLIIYIVGIIIPTLAVKVRRLHDINVTGWNLLLVFIPFIGPFLLLINLITDGQEGTNRFGPNPKN